MSEHGWRSESSRDKSRGFAGGWWGRAPRLGNGAVMHREPKPVEHRTISLAKPDSEYWMDAGFRAVTLGAHEGCGGTRATGFTTLVCRRCGRERTAG